MSRKIADRDELDANKWVSSQGLTLEQQNKLKYFFGAIKHDSHADGYFRALEENNGDTKNRKDIIMPITQHNETKKRESIESDVRDSLQSIASNLSFIAFAITMIFLLFTIQTCTTVRMH